MNGRRTSPSRHLALLVRCSLIALLGCSPQAPLPAEGSSQTEPPTADIVRLGDGFAVWESNRSGDWRIWIRRFDGSVPRQLSPDDGQQHCCSHVSPDGRRIVYLSRTTGRDRYPEHELPGPLRLIDLNRGEESELVGLARTYGSGNRCAVWRDDRELIYVDGEGRTVLLDVEDGSSQRLTSQPRDELGWLIDPSLRYATTGEPSFAPYDSGRQQVSERRALGGCEPYFSHDGRWGYWIAGAGGPVNRIDLATREVSTLLRKNDPRISGDQGYIYFPMASRDGQLFAFGASADEHHHFRSNYDIYVTLSNPRTLELIGEAVRLTSHPATDRYPDVFLEPLELGRHFGEAPLTVELMPDEGAGRFQWHCGSTDPDSSSQGRCTFRQAGAYDVQARRGEELLRAWVVVDEPRPPRAVAATPDASGRRVRVQFDEPVRFSDLRIELASGLAVTGSVPGEDDRSLIVDLQRPIEDADRLYLEGVVDRAQVPNRMPPAELEIAAPGWPSDHSHLLFSWQTADQPNLVRSPDGTAAISYALEPRGRARLDRHHAMVLGGGAFVAPPEAAERFLERAQATNEITLEATLASADLSQSGPARVITFSSNRRRRNLTLGQEGRDLVLRIRTGPTGPNGDRPQVRLFELAADRQVHLVVTYTPGLLHVYRDGELVEIVDGVQGGFEHWELRTLLFGDEADGGADWAGTLEGIAVYDRVLEPAEIRTNFQRYREILDARPAPTRLEVRARLRAKSEIPTLDQISPYRQALAVYEYEVEEVVAGETSPGALRVAHWAILGGETLPIAAARPGETSLLTLEPFSANPQLASHYLSDTLAGRSEADLFYDAGP